LSFDDWLPYAETDRELYNNEEEFMDAVKYEWRRLINFHDGVIEERDIMNAVEIEHTFRINEVWGSTFCEGCLDKDRRACDKPLYPNWNNKFLCKECINEDKEVRERLEKFRENPPKIEIVAVKTDLKK
jgi:hypothetical protein